jgi:hypothetical protein
MLLIWTEVESSGEKCLMNHPPSTPFFYLNPPFIAFSCSLLYPLQHWISWIFILEKNRFRKQSCRRRYPHGFWRTHISTRSFFSILVCRSVCTQLASQNPLNWFHVIWQFSCNKVLPIYINGIGEIHVHFPSYLKCGLLNIYWSEKYFEQNCRVTETRTLRPVHF